MRTDSFNNETENSYRDFFENMLTGNTVFEVIYDASGIPVDHRLLRANAQFETLTGLKRADEVGKTSAQLSFKWPDEVRQEYYSIAERGGSLSWERYNESLKTYYDAHVFSPKKGQFAVIFYDITARKAVEVEVRQERDKAHAIIDSISDPVFIMDLEGRFLEVNQAACEHLGYSLEELLLMGPAKIDTLEFAAKVPERIKTLQEKGRVVFETVHVRKDGMEVPVELNAKCINIADEPVIISVARDITKRKLAEKTLAESEERNRLLFSTILDGVLITEPNGKIFAANPSACTMLQRTEEEILRIGRNGVVDVSDPNLAIALEERKRTGKFIKELILIRKDGTKFPAEVSSAVFKDKEGNTRTSMTIRDISDRKRLKLEGTELLRRIESLILELDKRPDQRIEAEDQSAPSDKKASRLSNRHRDVLQLIAKGLTSAEITDRLNISQSTVITHRRNIMRKLGLHSAAELTAYAIKNKIVS